jgi:hypothetical protein
MIPAREKCSKCGDLMGRWGWYESPGEPVVYWYCYRCDEIRVLPGRKEVDCERD